MPILIFVTCYVKEAGDTSTTPPHPFPLPRLFMFEEALAVQRLAAFMGVMRLPVGEIAFVGVITTEQAHCLPDAFEAAF